MDKLKMQTADGVQDNISRIAELFPECITEVNNQMGGVKRSIDFDKLRQLLSSDIVEGNEERYQFTWPDKRKAILAANAPINATLRPCPEESVDFDTTQNLYIEGDNLDVLKCLKETYLHKVKMIYIDPPYNTGNDFVYEDDFAESASEYLANSGQFDEQGNRLVTNTESNGRFHTDWLNMIYPRLKVARDLLTEDGVIFISIDDNEVENLKKVCNEIFGEQNFVGNIIWQSRTSISNDDEISTNHNHTIIFSKNREKLSFGGDDIDESDYSNPDNDPRGPWKLVPIDANHVGGDTNYPIRNPKTGVDYYPPNGRIWCYNKSTLDSLMKDNRIKFGLTDDSSPKRKLFLNERKAKGDFKTPSSILVDAGTTKTGTTEIMALFDNQKVFDYPKPTSLLTRLMQYGYVNNNDIVLDFFSGSGTTAHAFWKYEIIKEISAKFILVQLPEDLDKSLLSASTDAKKNIRNAIDLLDKIGKPHLLTEIAKERIRRAGAKIKAENPEKAQHLDTGFRVLKLDSSNMKDVFYSPKETSQLELFKYVDNVKDDRTSEDLLFQVMLELGATLDSKIEESEVDGKTIFNVGDGYLVACFDQKVTDEVVTSIAKMQPTYAVLRDTSLADDATATNFEQIFKTYAPNTTTKIL
ncbi:site-specific DNA-methyltransferase [Leyella stercorea]|uniref:site-specific DNA-methyltransferase n=1 Tax=Leyella stercorea TaxID=363265 RepID=UPI00242B00AE|nr:site-specific DNA-methyltransferase [Leyella stercorea]